MGTVKVANGMLSVDQGAIHLTKISGNFGPKLNGSVRSNRKRFDITGPPFEVDHFSRSDRSEFWMNGLDRAHCDVSLPVGASKPKKWTKREGKWGKRKLSLPHPLSYSSFFSDGKVSRGVKQYTASVDMR